MPVEVKIGQSIFTFDDWETIDNKFIWSRTLVKLQHNLIAYPVLEGQEGGFAGIVLLWFADSVYWESRYFSPHLSIIFALYKKLYPSSKSFTDVELYKQHIDKFLHQVNKLQAFI